MGTLYAVLGTLMVVVTLWEAFETMILPRAILRPGRVTHLFYRAVHGFERGVVRRIPGASLRNTLLGACGPLSVLFLIILWAVLIILGFGMVHYGLHTHFKEGRDEGLTLGNFVYFSGSTFYTLGYGDLTPSGTLARILAVVEAGVGFGMLAAVMGYLPVLYGAFSAREAAVIRLANRCGGDLDGVALVARYARTGNYGGLATVLEDLEVWLSELLESTVSYPMLALYRSPRNDRSWVGAIAAVLDATAVLQLRAETPWPPHVVDQAELTFSMAHRTLRAIDAVLRRRTDDEARRPRNLDALRARLAPSGVVLAEDGDDRWEELVRRYEPEAVCLADFLMLDLPRWPAVG